MEGYTDVSKDLGWDDEIQNDSQERTLLPEGDYPFEVTKFERGRYQGGAKLPPCNMAILSITVRGGKLGDTFVTHRLYLHTNTEGLLCAFFESIGQRKHGEALRPRWNDVVGSNGVCRLEQHEYTKNDGSTAISNQIKRFLPPVEKAAPDQGWTQGHF